MSAERNAPYLDYDLVVIGGGIPSYLLAEAAVQAQARVAFVPSTRLMTMATYQTDRLGNWLESLSLLGVDVLMGGGYFSGRQTFVSQGRTLGARLFVLAIPPQRPPIKIHGLAAVPYVTSEDFFKIERIPTSIAILGEDALSCTIAQSLCRAGTKVTLLVAQQLLPQVDSEVSRLLQTKLEIDGIDVLTMTTPSAVDMLPDGRIKLWTSEQGIICHSLYLPLVMEDYLASLNLWAARVKVVEGMIVHNEWGQTTNPRVFVCQQAAEIPSLLRQILWFNWGRSAVPVVPTVVNTEPGVASIGMTELQARRRYGKSVRVWRYPLLPQGLCKLVCLANGKIVGAHLLSDKAAEVIETIGLVMKWGLRLTQLSQYRWEIPSLLTEIAQQVAYRQQTPGEKLQRLRWLAWRRWLNF
ncbi:MAG: FAD-dependent oxidoreductase [Pseudanabaenaceae cyanobacterium SKYGB_i_bin29]|nr:FAD-dependent oxidoreductase [Pseudanabaenaceae cyanobacterium SKYG29]MDW8422410.1 FAD-dependent oxidoreductase [Pseudanabaenaceae cyanobacterium SKYGB_i_bin29]